MLSARITGSKFTSNLNGLQMTIPGKFFNNYTHTIAAFGGYDTAVLNITVKKNKIEDFLFNILGNTIQIVLEDTEVIWEGFINEIVLTFNGNDISVGPLMEISNKVLVRYTDYLTGVPGVTTYANNLLSQERFGLFTRVLAGIQVSITNAENIRNNYLEDNRFPAYNFNLTLQENGDSLQVTLNCLGFYHKLETYVYNNALTGSYTVREKIIDILSADPSGMFTRFGLIGSNTLSVLKSEVDDRLAIDVVKELVGLGSDNNNNRTTFGIYNDLTVIYGEIPTTVRFYYRNSGNTRYIYNSAHGKIDISRIKAGEFIGIDDIPDYMSSGLKSVPKFIFAENVSYTAPFGLSITGTNVSTLSQRLAKLGLSGLS